MFLTVRNDNLGKSANDSGNSFNPLLSDKVKNCRFFKLPTLSGNDLTNLVNINASKFVNLPIDSGTSNSKFSFD